MITASGIFFLTRNKQALFLKRGNGSDHPLEWCFPGGQQEDGETIEECAIRETAEEAGVEVEPGMMHLLTRSTAIASTAVAGEDGSGSLLPAAPSSSVDFTTFIVRLQETFEPTLCEEHTAFAWADINTPPEPLHPGCRIAIARVGMDELGVARAMAAGDLTSPQRYENMSLVLLRLTGTGVAYRKSLDEFVWRRPEVYLNEDFVARCSGLPVILEHPKGATLTSKEFRDRIVGTVFLPFIRGEEVWAVARIYDDATVKLIDDEELSTSPSVVFRDPTVNSKFKLDESTLLVEGKPSLLDHVAICTAGVWDKGTGLPGVEVVADTQALGEESILDHSKLSRLHQNLTLLNIRMSNRQRLKERTYG